MICERGRFKPGVKETGSYRCTEWWIRRGRSDGWRNRWVGNGRTGTRMRLTKRKREMIAETKWRGVQTSLEAVKRCTAGKHQQVVYSTGGLHSKPWRRLDNRFVGLRSRSAKTDAETNNRVKCIATAIIHIDRGMQLVAGGYYRNNVLGYPSFSNRVPCDSSGLTHHVLCANVEWLQQGDEPNVSVTCSRR